MHTHIYTQQHTHHTALHTCTQPQETYCPQTIVHGFSLVLLVVISGKVNVTHLYFIFRKPRPLFCVLDLVAFKLSVCNLLDLTQPFLLESALREPPPAPPPWPSTLLYTKGINRWPCSEEHKHFNQPGPRAQGLTQVYMPHAVESQST